MFVRAIAVLFIAVILRAQSPRPAFEVASIKPSPGCRVDGSGGPSAGRLELPCVTLRALIRIAYTGFSGEKLNTHRIDVMGGPGWLDNEQFTLAAKAEGNPSTGTMLGSMLQALLEERFQLKVHTENRETPVYALTVAKGGPKLTPAKDGSCIEIDLKNLPKPDYTKPLPKLCGGPSITMKNGKTIADIPGATIDELGGRLLSMLTGRPVIDRTALDGRFDMHLEFARDSSVGPPPLLNGVPAPNLPTGDGPSIFTALQEQLGLKLVADKAPIPVIIVDSVQKPTEN